MLFVEFLERLLFAPGGFESLGGASEQWELPVDQRAEIDSMGWKVGRPARSAAVR